MNKTPFVTAKKQVRHIVPGDIIVSSTMGAKLVTHAARNIAGEFVFYFGLPDDEGKFSEEKGVGSRVEVDRYWGETEFTVIVGALPTSSEIMLLREQLAARDAALDAVLKLAKEWSANDVDDGRVSHGSAIVDLLVKHGVHEK